MCTANINEKKFAMKTKNQKQKKVAELDKNTGKVITPMMAQYLSIKHKNPDGLLFYRMGDFYELFFEDAVIAAACLNITLTKRGKHMGEDIAMCGVPAISHEDYLARLIKQGHKVVICEQIESPAEAKKRGTKSVVQREVVRTVTAGTLIEDALLDEKKNNFLLALAEIQSRYAIAWLDMSTGDLQVQSMSQDSITAVMARVNPGEILISEKLLNDPRMTDILSPWNHLFTVLPFSRFDSTNGGLRLQNLFKVKTMDAFGNFSRAELAVSGALIDYLQLTQKGQLPRIAPPKQVIEGSVLEIDAATHSNLELTQTLKGERKGSLLSSLDKTLTASGARLFSKQLSSPLTDVDAINTRLDAVQFFYEDHKVLASLRNLFTKMPDIERALSRISLARGSPRDLAAIRDGLSLSAEIHSHIHGNDLPKGLENIQNNLDYHTDLVNKLDEALAIVLPPHTRDGGFIARGYSRDFDELCKFRDESRQLVVELQAKYINLSGVQNLKIKHNNVLGYFVEVSLRNKEFMTAGLADIFIHRQTMKNAIRYSTLELSELEGKIASAADKILAMELAFFADLANKILKYSNKIAVTAAALAQLDVTLAIASMAIEKRYTRPIVDEGFNFEIIKGRHAVVENPELKKNDFSTSETCSVDFVANDCILDGKSNIWLLTGPNMAGKSTFLRQNALIVILAQMGCYVPAQKAHIGVVDRLFSRVGAADDLARGRSTFMVEMVETAAILSQATDRSFVILDEIGRGTATFDGLSIAWAVVEYLYKVNKSRAIFATHYHELTKLESKLDGLSCHMMRVKEWDGNIIFLHEVVAGSADRSYGIHVGQLAGLPLSVVNHAKQVLISLEKGNKTLVSGSLAADLPLFAIEKNPNYENKPKMSDVEIEIDSIFPDDLSPKEALELIYKLKDIRGK